MTCQQIMDKLSQKEIVGLGGQILNSWTNNLLLTP